jgi:hypothetical protein
MMLAVYIASGVISYATIGFWTFGHCCGKWAAEAGEEGYTRSPSYYYDEPEPWFASIFWPVFLLFAYALKHWIWFMIHTGERGATRSAKSRKLRIEIEKKIRVEQEKIEREAEKEIEETLRREAAA